MNVVNMYNKKQQLLIYSDDISHHGIKGQKWGVRNGPPYPIDNASRRHVKKNKKSTSAKRFVEKRKHMPVSRCLAGAGEEYVTIAIALATSIGLTFANGKIIERRLRKQKIQEFEELNKVKSIKTFRDTPKLTKRMSPSESMKLVNPGYPNEGYTENCVFCTTAMALREKGYDVKAGKLNGGTFNDYFFKRAFNSQEIKMPRNITPNSLLHSLTTNGEGTYGNLVVEWKGGGAHSVFWKVEQGKTHIYDSQSALEYTKSSTVLDTFTKRIKLNKIIYNRLDNCEPTEFALVAVEKNKK